MIAGLVAAPATMLHAKSVPTVISRPNPVKYYTIDIQKKFNLEQIFEFGQLGIYDNVEDKPEIEIEFKFDCVEILGKGKHVYIKAMFKSDNMEWHSHITEANTFEYRRPSRHGVHLEICEAGDDKVITPYNLRDNMSFKQKFDIKYCINIRNEPHRDFVTMKNCELWMLGGWHQDRKSMFRK